MEQQFIHYRTCIIHCETIIVELHWNFIYGIFLELNIHVISLLLYLM